MTSKPNIERVVTLPDGRQVIADLPDDCWAYADLYLKKSLKRLAARSWSDAQIWGDFRNVYFSVRFEEMIRRHMHANYPWLNGYANDNMFKPNSARDIFVPLLRKGRLAKKRFRLRKIDLGAVTCTTEKAPRLFAGFSWVKIRALSEFWQKLPPAN